MKKIGILGDLAWPATIEYLLTGTDHYWRYVDSHQPGPFVLK